MEKIVYEGICKEDFKLVGESFIKDETYKIIIYKRLISDGRVETAFWVSPYKGYEMNFSSMEVKYKNYFTTPEENINMKRNELIEEMLK